MATNPGEWYEEQRAKAELAGARMVLAAVEGVAGRWFVRSRMHDAAREVVRRLERQLELARYVGD